MSEKRLSGKVVIVTGAGRGIGAAIARRLALDGAKVAVNFNTSAGPAEETVKAISAAGGEAAAIQADVSDATQIKKLFEQVEKRFGTVTVLVNNAGVYEMMPLEKADKAHFEKIFHANVLATLLTTAEYARRIGSGGGRIVNISSGGARGALPGAAVYCASKAAMEGLTRGHALELGPKKVTVNTVAPGVTETEMLKSGLPEEMKKHMIANTTLGRLGQPDDIADVVAFLCSEDARWITGQFIDANGGLRF